MSRVKETHSDDLMEPNLDLDRFITLVSSQAEPHITRTVRVPSGSVNVQVKGDKVFLHRITPPFRDMVKLEGLDTGSQEDLTALRQILLEI